jgi:replicative DNA helicase
MDRWAGLDDHSKEQRMNAPKALPFNEQAEEAVITAAMVDNTTLDRLPFLEPEHFYRDAHKVLWQAYRELRDAGTVVDPITVTDHLEQTGRLKDVGGPAGVTRALVRTESAIHAEHYAGIVYRDAVQRGVIFKSDEAGRKASAGGNILELRSYLEAAAAACRPIVDRDALNNGDLARRVIDLVKRTHETGVAPLLPCGVEPLAQHIHGWERTKVTVFGALSSVGKTSFAVAEAVFLAHDHNKHVVFVNIEIDAPALTSRFLSHIAGLDETQIVRGFMAHDVPPPGKDNKYPHRRWSKDTVERDLETAAEVFAQLPISIVARDYDSDPPEEPDFTPAGIVARLRKIDAARPIDFVVIDHLYILQYAATGDAYKMSGEYGDTVMQFRKLAEYTGAHVLILHQLDPQKALQMLVPNAATFPGSQRIWQNTDNLIALYAPHMHDRENRGDTRTRAFNIIKARRGITGTVDGIIFDGAISNFDKPAAAAPRFTAAAEPEIEF